MKCVFVLILILFIIIIIIIIIIIYKWIKQFENHHKSGHLS